MDDKPRQILNHKDINKILGNVSDSIIILNPKNNKIVYFNKAAHKSLGYTETEFIKIESGFFTKYNDEEFIRNTIKLVVEGERVAFISKHLAKDNSIQYADINLSSIEINNSIFVCGIWKDITADVLQSRDNSVKKNRLEKFLELLGILSSSDEFLSTDILKYSYKATPLISKTLDVDRVSIRLYDSSKDMLESICLYDRNQKDKILGKNLSRIEYPVFFDYIEANQIILITDIAKSKTLEDMIKVFFSEDGMIHALLATRIKVNSQVVGYIFLQSREIKKWDKEYVLFVSQIADQIGIMLTNKELKQQQVLLEKKVEERTKALEISKDIAEKATLSKSRFLSNMSHEIRTPLNAIIGFLSLIDTSTLTPKNVQYINYITEGSNDLIDIVNDVLDLSKVEAGKMDARLEWHDLKELFDKKVHFFTTLFKNNKVLFEYDFSCSNNVYFTDKNILKLIMNNLLSNALKYTKEGKVKLILRERKLSAYESQITIIVEDTGIGIQKKDYHKIFKTYEQIDEKNFQDYKGTGLGLALTKQLVELLKGTIFFNSTYLEGSTFTVTIPMQIQHDVLELSQDVIKKSDTTQLIFKKKKALIVDDNRLNQIMLLSFFEDSGLEIDTAENGYIALTNTENTQYDIVFMDLQMPVMDGLTASKLIRLDKKNLNTPIIALTANTLQNDDEKQKNAIFDDYLTKPISKTTLFNICQHFLDDDKETIVDRVMTKKTFLESLEDLAQISIKDGLHYVNNNEMLYQVILYEFIESHANDYNKLLHYMNQKDTSSSLRLIHTLKGLLKTIGMNDIYTKMVSFEDLLVHGEDLNHHIIELQITKEVFEKNIEVIRYIYNKYNKTEV